MAPYHGYGSWVNRTSVLIKVDASGTVQWKNAYGNETDPKTGGHAYSFVQTADTRSQAQGGMKTSMSRMIPISGSSKPMRKATSNGAKRTCYQHITQDALL